MSERYIYNKDLNIAFCIGSIMIDEVDINDVCNFLDYLNVEDSPKMDVVSYLYEKTGYFGIFDIFLMMLRQYGNWKIVDNLDEVDVCKVFYINNGDGNE